MPFGGNRPCFFEEHLGLVIFHKALRDREQAHCVRDGGNRFSGGTRGGVKTRSSKNAGLFLLKRFDDFFTRFGERLFARGKLHHERKGNVQWISSEFQMLRQDMFWVNQRTRCISRKETICTSNSVFWALTQKAHVCPGKIINMSSGGVVDLKNMIRLDICSIMQQS